MAVRTLPTVKSFEKSSVCSVVPLTTFIVVSPVIPREESLVSAVILLPLTVRERLLEVVLLVIVFVIETSTVVVSVPVVMCVVTAEVYVPTDISSAVRNLSDISVILLPVDDCR